MGVSLNPVLTWKDVAGADFYVVQVAKNPSFSPLLETDSVTNTTYQTTLVNELASVYYWRVKAVNSCNETPWSKTWAFQTDNEGCVTLESADVPVAISDNSLDTVFANIQSNVDFTLNKIQTYVNISHGWVGDLRARMISPTGTSRLLFDQPGVPADQFGCSEDNIVAAFYDTAPNTAADFENTCDAAVPAISGDFQPIEPFSAYLTDTTTAGTWKLEIIDFYQEDGGAIDAWTIDLCGEVNIDTVMLLVNNQLEVFQGLCDTITNAFLKASGTPAGMTFVLLTLPANGSLKLMGVTLGVGNTFTQKDIDDGKLVYCHNGSDTDTDNFHFDVLSAGNGWLHDQVFSIKILENNLAATAALTQVILCNNANNAQITVTASGGFPPYTYSLNGGAFQSSNVFNNLAAGSFTVTVKDNTGFTVTTNTVVVVNPPALNVSASASGNSIIVTANGGTPPYTYSIDGATFQASNTFNNLPNGTYTVTVKDANGCTKTTTVIVAVNTLAAVATITQQISCFGGNDGVITVTVAGGTPPYTYSLNGGLFQSSNVFSNLPAGSYVVTVMDVNGFSINTNPVTLSNPLALNLSASVSGNSITVTASGGTPGYTYSIDGVNFQASNVFNNLPNGTYTVTVKDSKGCTKTTTAVVSVNVLSASATVTQAISCNGGNDGKITVTASGGAPPYTYSLNGGAFQSSNMFSNLAAGTYNVTVKDANGTTVAANSVTLSNPPALTVSASVSANSIIVTAGGGTPGYTYSIDGVNFQASNIFNNLPNGVYTVTVKDSKNCIKTTTAVVAVNTLIASASISKNISCNGGSDGQITIFAGGGTPPYTYSLNGGPFQSSNVFGNLPAGTYSATVKDDNGFVVITNNVTLTDPPALTVSAAVTGNTITVTASGGTGALTYSIDGVNFQASNEFLNVPNGSYTVTVKDANGCTKTTTAVVSVNTLAASAAITQNISCNGGSNGSISITANGGTPPYTYSLNGGAFQSSNVFGNLSAGSYTVTVKDANGFTITTNSVTLTNPPALAVSTTVIDDDITVTATGGTGALTYSIDGVNFQVSNLFNNLPNGVYTITVKDANGCTKTTTAVIAVNSLLVSAAVSNDISCFGGNDGAIVVTVGGGTPPYQYSLNGGVVQTSNIFYNLSAGTYTVVVTDGNGQTATTNTVILNNPPQINVMAAANGYTVTVTANGGSGALQYSLDGSPFQFGNVFFPIPNGTHTVKVKDGKGCEVTTTVTVSVPALTVSAAITQAILCNGVGGTITATASGGIPPRQFSLNGGAFQNSNIFSSLPPGTYWVTVLDAGGFTATSTNVVLTSPPPLTASGSVVGYNVTITASGGVGPYEYSLDGGAFQASNVFPNLSNGDYVITVKDANGCTTQINVNVDIAPLQLSAMLSMPTNCHDSTNAVIVATASGGAPPFQYSLNGGAYQSSNVFGNLGPGNYTVTVKDAGGITATAATVVITAPPAITVSATAFGPDITVTASGGTGALTYSLDGINFQASNKLTTTFNGTFTVTVKDANGCIKTTAVSVNAPREASFTVTDVSCFGANDGQIEIDGVNGGVPPYLFSVDGSAFTSTLVYANLAAGNHTVVVQDVTGYQWTAPTVVITQPAELEVQTEIDGSKLILHASGGTGAYQYSIDGGLTFQADSVFTNLSNGSYQVVVKDENGCTVTTSLTPSDELYPGLSFELFPNPNDGFFTLKIELPEPRSLRFALYDVMGRMAHEGHADAPVRHFQQSFDLRHLSGGVYQLQLSDGDRRGMKRLVIVR
jgi:subtilisin-like proprotein convertase family protein